MICCISCCNEEVVFGKILCPNHYGIWVECFLPSDYQGDPWRFFLEEMHHDPNKQFNYNEKYRANF